MLTKKVLVSNLTFRGPCIVIYSYNKNQRNALISRIYFWNRTLHVSDSFSVYHQESSTVHTAIGICHTGYADCLLAGSEWNCSKHVEFHSKNTFEKLAHLVGFIMRLRWSRGSVLAFGTQVRGFKPGRSLRIFRAKKSSERIPSEGK
jgi:hypothetical protein